MIGDPATDGQIPLAGLVLDAGGNLYGTTDLGGANGVGTVFELSPGEDGRWIETILHSFNNNGSDGYLPSSNLIFDASGNLYGTTPKGGTGNCRDRDGVFLGCGTVFEVSPGTGGWTETVLHSFENTPARTGSSQSAGLLGMPPATSTARQPAISTRATMRAERCTKSHGFVF